jgi:hypothetical protein
MAYAITVTAPHLVQHLNECVCVRDHLQLQALAGHPEGLLRDVTDGPDCVVVGGLQQLKQQNNKQ